MAILNKHLVDWIKLYNDWEYEKALVVFNDVLSEEFGDLMTLFYKWNTYWALWNFSEAIHCFDAVLEKEPLNEKAKKAKEIFENMSKNTFSQEISDTWCMNYTESEVSKEECSYSDIPRMSAPMSPAPMVHAESEKPWFWWAVRKNISKSKSIDQTPSEKSSKKDSAPKKDAFYEFLKSSEAKNFFDSKKWKTDDIKKVIDNFGTNELDKEKIALLIKDQNEAALKDFIKNVKLRNSILEYLADTNILAPRKYNTITSQIVSINAEFWLAYLMFNLSEDKYNEILITLWEKSLTIKSPNITPSNHTKETSEKIWILKVITSFFISIFWFEKSFANENNKLRYFKYLFVFLGFLSVLVLMGYGIKNNMFKADIKATRTLTSSWVTESYSEVHVNK